MPPMREVVLYQKRGLSPRAGNLAAGPYMRGRSGFYKVRIAPKLRKAKEFTVLSDRRGHATTPRSRDPAAKKQPSQLRGLFYLYALLSKQVIEGGSCLPNYIMPPISPIPPPGGIADLGSGISVTRASVVRIMAAIEAAFSTALRVTLAGSMMPDFSMSS